MRTIEESVRRGRITEPGTRDALELLRGLGLVRDGRLLHAAVVLFGLQQKLEAQMPQCLLRVARFRGNDKTEFLDNRQFNGNLFTLLQYAERFLRENLPIAGRLQPELFERNDDPLYPFIALREALANAFCHRDYSIGGGAVSVAVYDNRLEITSSGTLHFGLTPESLYELHDSLPWNPLIARTLYRRGLIETWGRGTLKIIESVASAGLPKPEILESGGCVVVRFLPSHYLPPQRVTRDISERQRQVLTVLDGKRDGVALNEIIRIFQLEKTPWLIRDDLTLLKTLGLVDCKGRGRGAKWIIR